MKRNKFITRKVKTWKFLKFQGRAPKNNRDLSGQNSLNFHGVPFGDKSDASWLLMMHHEYSWCIMSTCASVLCLPSENEFLELIPGFWQSSPWTPPRDLPSTHAEGQDDVSSKQTPSTVHMCILYICTYCTCNTYCTYYTYSTIHTIHTVHKITAAGAVDRKFLI